MRDFIVKQGKKLKIGYTTGSCATAAAKAAAKAIFTGSFVQTINLEVPAGITFDIGILEGKLEGELEVTKATCAVRKYSGDDPDVTDGMLIYATVEKLRIEKCKIEQNQGFHTNLVIIDGGEGIGKVTKRGLSCEVGTAAINQVPRKMIEHAVLEEMDLAGYKGGLSVMIWAPEGEKIAKKTFNERLGILGGISILGTSGVVEPMSESALIETIKIEMNQQDRNKILLASPGNYGIDFAREFLNLDMNQAVKYSNYLGEFLDHAVYCGFKKVLVVGHIGKMIKLAAGTTNTHSKVTDGRHEIMIAHSAMCGVKLDYLKELEDTVSVDDMHEIISRTGLEREIYKRIQEKIAFHVAYRVKQEMQIEFIGFSNRYGILIESPEARRFIEQIKHQEDVH
ncbi:MAG: cobalt-precorrin-5B (C(1))-methyltransferase CbiD [Eubacteriales bacterium]